MKATTPTSRAEPGADAGNISISVGQAASDGNASADPLSQDLRCPRCGYDVRGQIATWKAACPLHGRCSECGLEFEWADVCSPLRSCPQWCVEYVPGRAIPRGCAATLAQSFVPWRFWSRLRLAHPIQPRRLLLYLLLIAIVPILTGYILMQSTVAIMVRAQTANKLESIRTLAANRVPPIEQERADWESVRDLNIVVTMDRLPDRNYPTGMEVAAHFHSQEAWEEYWTRQALRLDSNLEVYRNWAENRPVIHMPYLLAIFEAVAFPFAKTSFGSISMGDNVQPYSAPADLYDALLMQRQGPGQPAPGRWSILDEIVEFAPAACMAMAGSTILLIVFPLTFILLPITRRRATVRWVHFGRITAYSFFIPCAVFWTAAAVALFSAFFPNQAFASISTAVLLAMMAPLPMALLWWYFAIRCHLRLPNAFWLVAIMSVLTILLVPAAVMGTYYAGQFIEHFLWMATV